MKAIRLVVGALAGILAGTWLGCDSGDDCEGGAAPQLRVVNMTGNALEEILVKACDGSDANATPLPPPGLADGDEITIELPSTGCWLVDYRGEGCESDPDFRIDDACAGETITWEIDLTMHACRG